MAQAAAAPAQAPDVKVPAQAAPPVKFTPASKTPAKKVPAKTVSTITPQVKPEPAKPAPAKAAPIKAAPIKPAPAKPAPVTLHANATAATYGDWMQALRTVKDSMDARPVLPVLAGVMICRNEARQVVIRSTNLEVFTEVLLEGAMLESDKPILVPIAKLLEALAGIRGKLTAAQAYREEIELIHDKTGRVTLSGFGRLLKLDEGDDALGMPIDDYPWPTKSPTRKIAHLQAGRWLDGLEWGLTGAGSDETLPMLTCVLLESTGKSLYFVATDRYRLVLTEVPAALEAEFKVMVPAKWAKLLRTLTGSVTLYQDESKDQVEPPPLLLVSGGVRVHLRVSSATFPSYRSLLPDGGNTWSVNRVQMLGDVIAASAAAGKDVPVRVTWSTGKYQVAGSPARTVESSPKADKMQSGYNAKFLINGLLAFTGEELVIEGSSATKPIAIRGERNHHRATYMLMPVRMPT